MRVGMALLAKLILMVAIAMMVSGCSDPLARAAKPDEGLLPPVVGPITKMNRSLRELPPPEQRVAVAVYGYTDQTGQFKPSETVQSLSRAVTQGATSVLIKALQDTSDGRWFLVVEREKLDNLLKERRIITDMRERYLGEKGVNPKALPPLLFAGVLLEGGIIGFDSNTRTGGAGARYLGIGGDVQYREDTVTVYLRAISTKTGEVMASVVAHKTIISIGVRGSAFKYVALDRILEVEAGITHNEPEQLAIQGAIEKAVYAMIMEGAARGIWAFADKDYQARAIGDFDREQMLASRATKAGEAGANTAVAQSKDAPAQDAAPGAQTANAQPAPNGNTTAQANASAQPQPVLPASGETAAQAGKAPPAQPQPAPALAKAPAPQPQAPPGSGSGNGPVQPAKAPAAPPQPLEAAPPAPGREKERVPGTSAGPINRDMAAAQVEAGERSELWTVALTAMQSTADVRDQFAQMSAAERAARAAGGQ